MKYFISHSSKDAQWVKKFIEVIPQLDDEVVDPVKDIFYSSEPETGSDVQENLLPNIDKGLEKGEIIILIVTESYLKSLYCFYELSLASHYRRKGKKVIILVQNAEINKRFSALFPDNVYIDAESNKAAKTFVADFKKKYEDLSEECKNKLEEFFCEMKGVPVPTDKPFIGMSEKDYKNAFSFVEEYHVEHMTFGHPSTAAIVSEKLDNAEDIYMVSTTGSGLLKAYKSILIEAVKNGINLSVIIADRESDFCNDIGEIEVLGQNTQAENCSRIAAEFGSTVQYLNEILMEARKGAGNRPTGKIMCYSGHTLIRQTVFFICYKEDSEKNTRDAWGWITCTMPPERTADNTPSFLVKGSLESNKFLRIIHKYCNGLMSLAVKRGNYFEIDGEGSHQRFSDPKVSAIQFFEDAKTYWQQKFKQAKENMDDMDAIYDAVLIEVAAQHPLVKKKAPNKEFIERLNKAVELYNQLTEEGIDVTIYVPGSRHMYKGVADDISLSEAGCEYLKKKGIPEEALLGDDMNLKYKGDAGVYNSADECYVASQIFNDGEFGKLICICAPNQLMRKTMLYVEFGCVPKCYSVTTDKMFHGDIVNEVFGSLNTVLYFDHSWQEENSECFIESREERRPEE